MIFIILKMLHLLALLFGAAASLGNIYLALSAGPHDLAAPGYTNMLRKLFRLTALGAITVLWITGLLLMVWRYGIWVEGFAFNAKIVLAVVLTAIIFFLNVMAPGWARSGGPPSYVPMLHWIGSFCLIGIVMLAVAAFN
ncbi:hypothetical protein [Salaquimonas pukyongi]|uniref:hypothetical protein n=1 Tax=Salaquimonas pukyongi TaxID=2712698 RepID=UPI00096BCBCA|nr:hypothetical protein [Salaquimonas pukyongi]